MYKPASTVLNHNPLISFPVAFYFGPERITVRTFKRIDDTEAVAIGPAQADRLMRTHAIPFDSPQAGMLSTVFDGGAIAAELIGTRYVLQDALTIARDPEILGQGVVSDRCDLVWLVSHEGILDLPHIRNVKMLPDRRGRSAIYAMEKKLNVLTLVTEYSDTRWEDALVVMKANPAQGYRIEFEGDKAIVPQLLPLHRNPPHYTPKGYPRFGSLVIEGPREIAAGGTATMTIRAVRHNSLETDRCQSEVYVEMVSGYAPHTRVRLRDGVAQIRVMAIGLEPGESMRLKVGWRFFPGLAEATLAVAPRQGI